MSNDLINVVIASLLSGGLGVGIASLINARAAAKRSHVDSKAVERRLPAEVDSVVVQGAEAAVLTMKSALESAQKRITELEVDRESDRKKILELERRVDELRAKVELANVAVAEAQSASHTLRRELEAFVSEQARRK